MEGPLISRLDSYRGSDWSRSAQKSWPLHLWVRNVMYLFPLSPSLPLSRFSSRKTASSLSDSGEMMALNSETVAAAAAAAGGVPFHLHV